MPKRLLAPTASVPARPSPASAKSAVGLVDEKRGVGQERECGGRGREALALANEEAGSKSALELLERLAHGRWRQVQACGGGRDAVRLVKTSEDGELSERDSHGLLSVRDEDVECGRAAGIHRTPERPPSERFRRRPSVCLRLAFSVTFASFRGTARG